MTRPIDFSLVDESYLSFSWPEKSASIFAAFSNTMSADDEDHNAIIEPEAEAPVDPTPADLPPTEAKIFRHLLDGKGHSRASILSAIGTTTSEAFVTTMVCRMRKRLAGRYSIIFSDGLYSLREATEEARAA